MKDFSSLFISHGAPTLPISDLPARAFLEGLARELPRPRAIIVQSPHWLTRELEIKAPARYQTWHDFGGFPEALYRIEYTPPGEAGLAARTLDALRTAGVPATPTTDARLDHGAWVPLMLMYPEADIPLVQVSATWTTPSQYFDLGRALRPLLGEGVLLVGSGGLVHNLREIEFDADRVPGWARAFDDWTDARLRAGDWDALRDYRRQAPEPVRAHPSEDHFLPLFFAGGAGGVVEPLHHSFSHGSLSMACYGFA